MIRYPGGNNIVRREKLSPKTTHPAPRTFPLPFPLSLPLRFAANPDCRARPEVVILALIVILVIRSLGAAMLYDLR